VPLDWGQAIAGGLVVLAFGILVSTTRWVWRGVPADVAIRCENDNCDAPHSLSQPSARWFHVEAAVLDSTPIPRPQTADDARITVFVYDESTTKREKWLWMEAEAAVLLTHDATVAPLLVGNISDQTIPLGGWSLAPRTWYLTPEAHLGLGRALTKTIALKGKCEFEVTVRWTNYGRPHAKDALFELTLSDKAEPRFHQIRMRAPR
jgi:hypothetical protein